MNNEEKTGKRRFGRGAPIVAALLGLALLAGVASHVVSATLNRAEPEAETVMSVVTAKPAAPVKPTPVPTAEITPAPPVTSAPSAAPVNTPAPTRRTTSPPPRADGAGGAKPALKGASGARARLFGILCANMARAFNY